MQRHEIAAILARHKGSKAEVARRGKVRSQTVSMWLAGGTNAKVARIAENMARDLLAKEEAEKDLAGDVNGKSARHVVEEIRKSQGGS